MEPQNSATEQKLVYDVEQKIKDLSMQRANESLQLVLQKAKALRDMGSRIKGNKAEYVKFQQDVESLLKDFSNLQNNVFDPSQFAHLENSTEQTGK